MATGVVKSCARQLGKLGGKKSASRPKAERVKSAKKAAATRKRNQRKTSTRKRK